MKKLHVLLLTLIAVNTPFTQGWKTQWAGIFNTLRSVYFINSDTGYIVGEGGSYLKTTNGGTNWTAQISGTTVNLRSVYFVNANTGYFVGENGTILKTSNGGGYSVGINNKIAVSKNVEVFPNPAYDKTTEVVKLIKQ